MKSREQLVYRALQYLGVLSAGQTPSAEDAKVVDDEVNPVLSDLARRNIYVWGDTDNIEDEAFVHLAMCVGESLSSDFGKPRDENMRLLAEARLKELRLSVDTNAPVRANYF